MKGVVKAVCICLILLQTLQIIQCVDAKSVRREELYQALSEAEYNTLEMLHTDRGELLIDGVLSEREKEKKNQLLIQELQSHLQTLVNSDTTIETTIYEADCEKGMLDVQVTAYFRYPIGKKGVITCRKAVILEEY